MSSDDIIRAWKYPEYRGSASLTGHPAGEITLDRRAFGGYLQTDGPECMTGPDSCTGLCCTWDVGGWCPPSTIRPPNCPMY